MGRDYISDHWGGVGLRLGSVDNNWTQPIINTCVSQYMGSQIDIISVPMNCKGSLGI